MTPAAVWAVLRRPSLWLTALRAARRMTVRGRLDRDWWEWRLRTAYGTRRRPRPDDVVSWLRWCRSYEQSR